MKATQAIKESLSMPTFITASYLDDLTDDDLLVRPVAGANHIAWQLGHLIKSEHSMLEAICPGSMPPLPEGFADRYTKETAGLDDRGAFHSKEQLLQIMDQQRAGTLAALDKLSDDDLDAPAPESLQRMSPNVGGILSMQGTHWMMHAGQWAVVRRKLGRQPVI